MPTTRNLAILIFEDVCSAGITAGIDMSLHVLARLLGRDVAVRTAEQMEYPWQPTV